MNLCPFCNLNTEKYYNTVIEETANFKIIPGLGALNYGYVLIIPKKHVYCMTGFSKNILLEYNNLIEKYRLKFKYIYGKYPIVFEHGTPDPCGVCVNCVIHAHTHIFNHNYNNEDEIIKQLNFRAINNIFEIKNKNYIYYKSPSGKDYITYNFEPISQIMRIFIAKDLEIYDSYDWRKNHFDNNIIKTINDLKMTKHDINYMNYRKTRGIYYLKKYLPNLFSFVDYKLIYDIDELLNLDFNDNLYFRPDYLIKEKMLSLEKNDATSMNVFDLFKKIKKLNNSNALLVIQSKNAKIPRYMNDGGFVVSMDIDKNVILEFVGKGFDGRELTHGKTVHESYVIPWNEILFIDDKKDILKNKNIIKYKIKENEYKISRNDRINFLSNMYGISKNTLFKNIPKDFNGISNNIFMQVFNNIVIELYYKKTILLNDKLNYFEIQGNIIDSKIEPWELSDLIK